MDIFCIPKEHLSDGRLFQFNRVCSEVGQAGQGQHLQVSAVPDHSHNNHRRNRCHVGLC